LRLMKHRRCFFWAICKAISSRLLLISLYIEAMEYNDLSGRPNVRALTCWDWPIYVFPLQLIWRNMFAIPPPASAQLPSDNIPLTLSAIVKKILLSPIRYLSNPQLVSTTWHVQSFSRTKKIYY
jgi:hypothetical protein